MRYLTASPLDAFADGEKLPMLSTENANSARRDDPKPIRLKPSRNQMQRSKLNQASEPVLPASPAPAPISPPPQSPSPQGEALIRRMRLKRSGQMREDIFAPEKSEAAEREDEY